MRSISDETTLSSSFYDPIDWFNPIHWIAITTIEPFLTDSSDTVTKVRLTTRQIEPARR
jgi:hypothetical protein